MNEIVGITRVRNESLIIEDTIRHFLAHVSCVILYDDASTDDTVKIARRAGGERIFVIENDHWRKDREVEETRHRALLLAVALEFGAEWVLCFDADERLVGDLPPLHAQFDGYRLRLFDGYLTRTHCDPYRGGELAELPRMWGPEYRDILMLFRTDPRVVSFVGRDQRAPRCTGKIATAESVTVKHFGKCLSVEHWEATCDYYATHFPKRYRDKWNARRGKAIHTLSDFNRTLYTWRQLMDRRNAWVKI